jgi:hypothetical protein
MVVGVLLTGTCWEGRHGACLALAPSLLAGDMAAGKDRAMAKTPSRRQEAHLNVCITRAGTIVPQRPWRDFPGQTHEVRHLSWSSGEKRMMEKKENVTMWNRLRQVIGSRHIAHALLALFLVMGPLPFTGMSIVQSASAQSVVSNLC